MSAEAKPAGAIRDSNRVKSVLNRILKIIQRPCFEFAQKSLYPTRVFQWDSDQDYTVEDRCIESQSCPADFLLPLHGAISYYPLRGQNCHSDEEANQFPDTA